MESQHHWWWTTRTSAVASNIGSETASADAKAGQGQSVVGLSTLEQGSQSNVASPSAPGEFISVAEPGFDDVFDITISSDSAITAQAFNNLDAFANSTSGNSTSSAGDELSWVAGIEDMDISIGGLSDLMAQAQGTADSEASAVSGSAEADAWMQSMGIEDLEMLISFDSDLTAISSIFGAALQLKAQTILLMLSRHLMPLVLTGSPFKSGVLMSCLPLLTLLAPHNQRA